MSDNRLQARPHPPRELSGRTVLICLMVFFAVVFTANAIMVRAATSTFGGVETASAYKAGLAFRQEIDAARAQDALNWKVSGHVHRAGASSVEISVDVADARGAAISQLAVMVRIAHPANARLDRFAELHPAGSGRYRGAVDLAPGQWTLQIDISRDERRVFRSRSRLAVP